MRLLLATLVLASFALPLATAHVIVCQGPDPSQPCTTISYGKVSQPPHTAISLDHCRCSHDAPLPLARVLP